MRENRQDLGVCAVLVTALLAAGCAGDEERFGMGWDPENPSGEPSETDDGPSAETDDSDDGGSTGGEPEGDEEGGDDHTGADGVCNPGMERQCLCDDGLHLGNQICNDAGDAWGACECDDPGDTDGGSTGGDPTDGGGDVAPTEVCYPGEDGSGNTCFELHYIQPDGYDYPPALGGDPNYRQPIAYIDLEQIDPDTMIAPNFRLEEIAEAFKGRYGIVQPHAIESLQALRNEVGGITVNSGYRPPEYNAGVGGATHSRHMYGDGFDLDPLDVGLSTLEAACTNRGGMLVEYNTHVHCDFRFDAVSVEFYGEAGAPLEDEPPAFSATLDEQGAGLYTASAAGFDEGEPLRRWYAYDASGALIEEVIGPVYVAPESAARVKVIVGAQVEIETLR